MSGPDRGGLLWAPDEVDRLRDLTAQGYTDRQIAMLLRRGTRAVSAQRILLGIPVNRTHSAGAK
jgi:hypothetical protein